MLEFVLARVIVHKHRNADTPRQLAYAPVNARRYRNPPPIEVLLEPVVDVALDPVVDVPVEPITGALGAGEALLGAVLPVEVLGGLAPPNGVTRGIAIGPEGWTPGRRATGLLGGEGSFLARHCVMNLLLCLPT